MRHLTRKLGWAIILIDLQEYAFASFAYGRSHILIGSTVSYFNSGYSIAFDAFVLGLTWVKTGRQTRGTDTSSFKSVILRDGELQFSSFSSVVITNIDGQIQELCSLG